MFFPRAVLMDEAGEGAGSGSTAGLIDPQNIRVELGIPHEVDDSEPKPAAPPAKKEPASDDNPRLKQIEADLEATRRQLADERASNRYWAEQARLARERGDDEEEHLSGAGRPVADAEVQETPEQFLDDVGKRGMKAIRERGFLTKAEAQQMVEEGVARANQNLQAARTDAAFDTQLAQEFPEIAADGIRVRNGEQPQSEIYKRAAPIFRQMVKMDPQLANSKSALIVAARQAAAEIKAEGKKVTPASGADDDLGHDDSRQARRRERIDRQRSDRSERGGEEGDGTPTLSADQRTILRNLKVSEEDFIKNSDRSAAAGGRRGR